MKVPLVSCPGGLGILAAFAGRTVRAGERPLLVVVEAPPALEGGAGEIFTTLGSRYDL